MNLRRKLFLCGLVVFLVGITFSLSSAQLAATPSSITPKGVAINFAQREMQASPQIRGVLQNLRQEIAARRLTFEVGYTAALDFRIEQLAGLQVPANFSQLVPAQNAAARQILQTLQAPTPVCSPTAPNFDWRKAFGVTAIRDQGACGSCWAFATVGAFEGSWRIFNGQAIESAEQDILDCNPWGYSCGGGWWAFPYLMNPGVATEASYPYTHVKGACRSVARPYHAIAWGYVGNDHNIPTVGALKQYLCAYGPLAVAVRVTPGFQAYTSGVFNEHAAGSVNHGVTLIGWDDAKQAWLIKNSWGTGWGETGGFGTERGYMWIGYSSNSIGYAAAWVRAQQASINLSGKWRGNDNGNYFIRQDGPEMWWLGMSADNGASWTNVFRGQVQGMGISGQWADVPLGRMNNKGTLQLHIVNFNQMQRTNQTGGFGGSTWSRMQ